MMPFKKHRKLVHVAVSYGEHQAFVSRHHSNRGPEDRLLTERLQDKSSSAREKTDFRCGLLRILRGALNR
jgi:hypothetical protein